MIKVISPGLYTSIQDLGRFGFRNHGVPNGGVMDTISANLANSLLNNSRNNAVLEITIIGPKLLFKLNATIAITGADLSPKINNKNISNYQVIQIKCGDVLSFGKSLKGSRSYVAVKGGIQSEVKLKSRSQFTNITHDYRLKKKDEVKIKEFSATIEFKKKGKISNEFQFFESNEIEVFPGPEFELFSKLDQNNLLNTKYTVSNNSNRMGYQMEEVVSKHCISMITSSVLPGTVQLLPSGQIVILMKDAQTTGGYPRVFQLDTKALCIMAQKKVGDHFKLKLSPTYI